MINLNFCISDKHPCMIDNNIILKSFRLLIEARGITFIDRNEVRGIQFTPAGFQLIFPVRTDTVCSRPRVCIWKNEWRCSLNYCTGFIPYNGKPGKLNIAQLHAVSQCGYHKGGCAGLFVWEAINETSCCMGMKSRSVIAEKETEMT